MATITSASLVTVRFKVGDRVTLRSVPGHWRIVSRDKDGTAWLEGKDSFAKMLASLSPCGIVGVTSKELLLDTTKQGELL